MKRNYFSNVWRKLCCTTITFSAKILWHFNHKLTARCFRGLILEARSDNTVLLVCWEIVIEHLCFEKFQMNVNCLLIGFKDFLYPSSNLYCSFSTFSSIYAAFNFAYFVLPYILSVFFSLFLTLLAKMHYILFSNSQKDTAVLSNLFFFSFSSFSSFSSFVEMSFSENNCDMIIFFVVLFDNATFAA